MMPRIMLVCGFGLGTSLVLKMTLDAVLREERIQAETFCVDESTAKGQRYDLVVTSAQFEDQFRDAGKPVVVIDNFLSKEEVRGKCMDMIRMLDK